MPAPSPIHYIIFASPKSGTEWLRRMLCAHPQIHCAETRPFGDFFDPANPTAPHLSLDKYVQFLSSYHGAPAADDPELMRVLRERDITLDLCPTSNLQIGVGSDAADDPLPRLLAADVPVTINTDDRTVSDLTLVREMERTVTQLGLSTDDIVTCQRRAYAVAFLHHDEDIRSGLSGRFEHWVSEHPAPVEQDAG